MVAESSVNDRGRWLLALVLAIAFSTLTLFAAPELRPFLPHGLGRLIGSSRQSSTSIGLAVEYVFSVLIYWLAFWLIIGVARRRRAARS